MNKLSWKDVFNSDKLGIPLHISTAEKVAKESGYHYFTFNGRVFEVGGNWQDSVCLESEL